MHPKALAQLARTAAEDKKAEDPILLEVSKLTNVARFFLIAHGNSDPHTRAIADNVIDVLKQKKIKPLHVEGMESGLWILIDYGSVMVHIFYKEVRQFYGLERLWGEAPRL